jgi:hypothetical protein
MMERNYIKRICWTRPVHAARWSGVKWRAGVSGSSFDIVNSLEQDELQNVDSTNVMPKYVQTAVLFVGNR